MSDDPPWLPAYVIERDLWDAFGPSNPNVFPPHLKSHAGACALKLSLVATACAAAREHTPDPVAFLRTLQTDPAFREPVWRTDLRVMVVYFRAAFLNAVQSALTNVKTFLDVYAVLMARAIDMKASIDGFHRKGNDIGRRFVDWLRGSVSTDKCPRRDDLVATVERHLSSWMSDAVVYRDQVVHHAGLNGWRDMQVPFDRDVKFLTVELVAPPAFPDGTHPLSYVSSLYERLQQFVADTLPLLPLPTGPSKGEPGPPVVSGAGS